MPSRQQQARLTLAVDGVTLGVWDDMTGGDTDSNSLQYFLGGMGPRISLGGSQQVANVVLMKLQDVDVMSRAKWLTSRVGRGKAVVTQQALDDEGAALGEPFVWQGVLKRAKPADRNAQSNTAALFEVEVEVNGQMA